MAQIFVHPLARSTSISRIAKEFEKFGPVEAVRIFVADVTPEFAIIEMAAAGSAQDAIKALNGTKIGGQVSEVVAVGVDPELFQ